MPHGFTRILRILPSHFIHICLPHWNCLAILPHGSAQAVTSHSCKAEEIMAAQSQEIEQMTTWRQEWYPDLPPTGGLDMGMGEMKISAEESKPFDQRFMEAMISHHQGAIEMAQVARQMAEHEEIRTLAETIIAAQQAEIEQMQRWLRGVAWRQPVRPQVLQNEGRRCDKFPHRCADARCSSKR
jgi:uncharacterized protein (DUF305 family)